MYPHRYTYDHSEPNIKNLIAHLSSHSIKHSVDSSTRSAKSSTPHSPAPPSQQPLAIFFPTSTQQTSFILSACNARRIAVTSFSGGTSFGGALTSVKGGVCVSFEEMKSVIRVGVEDLDCTVQPGLGWVELNEELRERGVWFPVDPAPGAKIGGMVSFSFYFYFFTYA